MSTFRYHVAPKSNGGFTTRPVRTAVADPAALLADIAAQSGTTPEQAEATLRAFFATVLDCGTRGVWSPSFLDLVSFRPTSGGSARQPDGFHGADDINAGVSIAFRNRVLAQWRKRLSLESEGERGKVAPVIDTTLCQSDTGVDRYIPGGLIQVRGDYLKFDHTDPAQGVFFRPATGPEVRAAHYGAIKPHSVIVLVPDTLSGDLAVRVATHIHGSVRSGAYTNPITTT